MNEYKETIMGVLNRGIHARRRELAWHCGCWVASPKLGMALAELEEEGKIAKQTHSDLANFDTYFEYYAI